MKIHLVTPRNPSSFWTYDAILPMLGVDCIFPNLSMPTVAGLTPAEHAVTLCDENVDEIDFDVDADIVGITGYIIHRKRMLEIAAEFRRRGHMVVIGGPYASLCPEELAPHCDVVFAGEAEETWGQFLADFTAGAGRWKSLYEPEQLPDLALSPMPRFDLLDVNRYHAMTIQFGRGCPFNCEFCDIIVVYGRRPRTKSVAQVLAEVQECHRLGAKQVFIVDDNFIGNLKLAKELLRELARWGAQEGYPLDFNTEVSVNVAADEELLELLRAAHVTTVFIGIESPRVASLKEAKKVQNTRGSLLDSVRKIQDYGIQVQAGMIVGFDHDDETIFEEQKRFIQEARIPVSMTGMLQAMPKTPLHERMQREGRLLSQTDGNQFVLSNIEPAAMSRLALYRGYRKLLAELYSFRNYRRRALDFLLHHGDPVHSGANLRAGDLAMLRRVARGTLLRGGWRRALFTLDLVLETLLRRPSRAKEAISFAVVHVAFASYMRELGARLELATSELEGEPGRTSQAA